MVFNITFHPQKNQVISQGDINPFYRRENKMKNVKRKRNLGKNFNKITQQVK